ncbi:crotonase/enoyl-CoA hydratase family protein [Amycolatopsis sp. 195334CR]|uniref:type II toxin-antitoxin system Rv0910 family toxin n=1 Tax=Amycolatopsis sp. 195334CR TaxID=2814588 RepID=UPI001A90AFC4|nr:crotonase/enoyl-CoA hydratase family protein [Amycolatopsis sp. 195334CR]MBN6042172.1 crotonase/enoyl-CoA hydratase family protein [Amycolatopsis sp. 195334CR]
MNRWRTARTVATALVRTAFTRAKSATTADLPEVPAPDGIDGYARHVTASGAVAAEPAAVVDLARDLGRTHEWLTLHAAWRGERPERIEPGAEFVQQIRLMDIPAQARWVVERADEHGFALRGTGPMGITLGLWCSVRPAPDGAVLRLDGALDGAPVRGPVGSTAVHSVERALHESISALAELVQGTKGRRLSVSSEPIRHERSGTLIDPRTPVVVGVGQVVNRRPDLDAPREPVALAAEALRAAAADAGADLLAQADLVYAVPSASWSYADQAGAVAELVGATRAMTVQTSAQGGDGGQLAINDAAQEIIDGRAEIALISGAEAGATMAALKQDPGWTRQPENAAPDRKIGQDRPANNEAETAVGLGAPIFVYPLLESALRGRAGTAPDEHRDRIAGLWSRFSQVAALNPYAWDPTARTPEEIATPTERNRWVSDPYTKLLCANLQVDLAAAVVVTSAGAAHAAGVPQDRWVFVHAGASATEEWFVSERADLAESPAIAAAGAAALGHAGITAAELGPVDLYSCFPAAVQLAANALGLPWDDPDRPLSVTGGLTSAGGPGNNYGTHAVASIVPLLRDAPAEVGLTTSLGWYATKHSVGVYSATPPKKAFAHLRPAFTRPATRPALTELDGEGVVEAATLVYRPDGEPEAMLLSVLTDDGARVLLRREETRDLLRCRVRVADGRIEVVDRERQELPPPPDAPVRTERRGPDGQIAVITLDRPPVRNAVNRRLALALEQAVDDAEADPSVRVLVLTGAGGTFCAGMDLAEANRGAVPVTDRRGPLGLTAEPPVKPAIAAVEGAALAGGFELALCADFIVAAEDAVFGLPEAKRGLLAAAGGLWRTATRLPRAVALELALVAEPLSAGRLAGLGLVNRVVPPGTALEAALELAGTIAANAPLSVRVGKEMIDAAPGWAPEEGFARQSELAGPVLLSDDAREGIAAFAERRAPVWSGR